MKLYEVNRAIEELLLKLEPDPETGEVPMEFDEMLRQLDSLQMERSRILEYLAKLVLNCRSDAASLRDEEKRLSDRRHSLENREERLMKILDRECGGEKTDCGVATVNYRKTSKVEITDYDRAILWLQDNHEDFIRYRPAEISKADVKKLMKDGTEIPGLKLTQDLSCSLN